MAVCPESGSSIHAKSSRTPRSTAPPPPQNTVTPKRLLGRPQSVLSCLLVGAERDRLCQRNSWREESRREGQEAGPSEGGGGQLHGAGAAREAVPASQGLGWWVAAGGRACRGQPAPLAAKPSWEPPHCLSTNQEHMQLGQSPAPCEGLGSSRLKGSGYPGVGYPTTLGRLLTPGLRACCSSHLHALPAPICGLMTSCSLFSFFFVN